MFFLGLPGLEGFFSSACPALRAFFQNFHDISAFVKEEEIIEEQVLHITKKILFKIASLLELGLQNTIEKTDNQCHCISFTIDS